MEDHVNGNDWQVYETTGWSIRYMYTSLTLAFDDTLYWKDLLLWRNFDVNPDGPPCKMGWINCRLADSAAGISSCSKCGLVTLCSKECFKKCEEEHSRECAVLRHMGDLRFFIDDRVRLILRALLWLKKKGVRGLPFRTSAIISAFFYPLPAPPLVRKSNSRNLLY